MTYHRARVCTSLTASSPSLASIVRLTNPPTLYKTNKRDLACVWISRQAKFKRLPPASGCTSAIPICCLVAMRSLLK